MFRSSPCWRRGSWLEHQARDRYVQQARERGYIARSAFKLLEIDSKYHLLRCEEKDGNSRGAGGGSGHYPPLQGRAESSLRVWSSPRPRAVLDLGCSPGSWCQVLRERCGEDCVIVAVDILPVKAAVRNTIFIQGDITHPHVQRRVHQELWKIGTGGEEVPNRRRQVAVNEGWSVQGEHASPAVSPPLLFEVVTSDMCPNRMGGLADRQCQAALQEAALCFSLPLLQTGGHFVAKCLGSRTAQEELWRLMQRCFRRVSAMKPLSSRTHSDETFLIGRDKVEGPGLGGNVGNPRALSSLAPSSSSAPSAVRPVPPHCVPRGARQSGTADGVSLRTGGVGGRFGLDDWPGFARRERYRRGP